MSNGQSRWKFGGAFFVCFVLFFLFSNLILNHFLILLNLSSQIWWCFMTFEINQWYQSQRRNWNMRGDINLPRPILAMLLVLNEVWVLGTFEYFQAFPVVLEKICLTVSKCFHVCAHKSFAYYQLQRNKSKVLDYISESFLRKGISWIVGDLIQVVSKWLVLQLVKV